MTDTATLERIKALVGTWVEDGKDAAALAASLRVLHIGPRKRSPAETWVSLTRAINRASDPGKVVGILESLVK